MDTDVKNLPPIEVPTQADIPQAVREIAPHFTIPDPMSAPALRWGIIGTGGIAATFAHQVPAYSTGNIVAVGSRRIDTAQTFANRFSIEHAHGSYEELVRNPDVEAVYVATPHAFHLEHALLAVRAGKPVLVEKAFTLNRTQAEHIFMEARAQGVFVMEAMWMRFLPHQLMVREILRSGTLGDIVHIRADHGQRLDGIDRLERLELGGGALLDLGVYPLSFIQSILGDPEMVDTVGFVNPAGVDENECVTLTYVGALALATANMRARSATSAEIVCRKGRIELREQFYQPGRITVTHAVDTPGTGLEDEYTWTWDGHVPGGLQYEAAEVARCVNADLMQSDTMPWDDTLAVLEIMDQARSELGMRYPGE
ncbi:MAG: Gfo/Idh/MocA family oxidoreductase [Actinomycetaceae bacterium]|nr:Gfo/Idh/MocA family oxidoreductase [Actinomycetaceae bacterium]